MKKIKSLKEDTTINLDNVSYIDFYPEKQLETKYKFGKYKRIKLFGKTLFTITLQKRGWYNDDKTFVTNDDKLITNTNCYRIEIKDKFGHKVVYRKAIVNIVFTNDKCKARTFNSNGEAIKYYKELKTLIEKKNGI